MFKIRHFINVPKDEQHIMNEIYDDGAIYSLMRYKAYLKNGYEELVIYLPSGSYNIEPNVILFNWED